MQPTGGGSSSGGGGGGAGLSRGGQLARFRSAPATWLEALLEGEGEEEEEARDEEVEVEEGEDPLKQNQCLTELLSSNSTIRTSGGNFVPSADPNLFNSTTSSGFLRQNSSPADFPSSAGYDAYFPAFGIPANYNYLSSAAAAAAAVEVSPGSKRPRDSESQHPSSRFPSRLKEEQSGQLQGGMGNLLDAEMEKLLEDSIPCRVRAKRGCATHPRSIAERVRRTRISDRIRKLQELVPNMDKQTNTADMLEEAVEYVKFLQKQIQELTEHQRKCKCLVRE